MFKRVIARLDIKGSNLVKGIHLEGLRVLGKPEVFAKHYFISGADELFYQDVVASLYERNSLHDIISKTAREIFIPLAVGGGIRSIEDIRQVLRAGADKVAINTAAIKNPKFISDAANVFGSSTIVVSIEAIKTENRYYAFTDNGREKSGQGVLEWSREIESLGAGEILITSVDNEGTGNGFDLELTQMISKEVSIPVIAHGGAGKINHIVDVFKKTNVSAVAIASLLHYDFLSKHRISDINEDDSSFVKSGKLYSRVSPTNIKNIKRSMLKAKIKCRN